jgi:hypothetical protein
MIEDQPIRYSFSVSAKPPKVHSTTELNKGRKFPTSITFHLEPPEGLGCPCDHTRNLFGEDLNRAVRLQQNPDPSVVKVAPEWWVRHCNNWQEDIIDLALQPFAFAKVPSGISG